MGLPDSGLRNLIRATEEAEPEERQALLCFLAGRSVTVDAHDLHAALRRSELLLAAGGDPRRPLELHGRAVTALAEDLDAPGRRAQLAAGLERLAHEADGLPGASASLHLLLRDRELAWQCFALSLLAAELSEE